MKTIITDYDSHQGEIQSIREQVFVVEQKVSRAEEFDDRDQACQHVLSYVDGTAVATGRIDLESDGRIGRVAVLTHYRRQGVGSAIMKALEEIGHENGCRKIWFHAQLSAVPFYEGLEYEVCSDEFEEADIPHVVMHKELSAAE